MFNTVEDDELIVAFWICEKTGKMIVENSGLLKVLQQLSYFGRIKEHFKW